CLILKVSTIGAAKEDERLAVAHRHIDHAADRNGNGEAFDRLLEDAVDGADGLVKDRSPRRQRAPAVGRKPGGAAQVALATEHVGKRPVALAKEIQREMLRVQ